MAAEGESGDFATWGVERLKRRRWRQDEIRFLSALSSLQDATQENVFPLQSSCPQNDEVDVQVVEKRHKGSVNEE